MITINLTLMLGIITCLAALGVSVVAGVGLAELGWIPAIQMFLISVLVLFIGIVILISGLGM